MEFKQIHVDDMMKKLKRNPKVIEMLIKSNLTNLAAEELQAYANIDELNMKAGKLQDILKLDRQRMRLAIKMNVTKGELRVLQASKIANVYLDEETTRDINKIYPLSAVNDLYFHFPSSVFSPGTRTLQFPDSIFRAVAKIYRPPFGKICLCKNVILY